jgi:hypothetical protein
MFESEQRAFMDECFAKNRNAVTSTQTKPAAHNIVWFEIPADNIERAKSFYGELFGWKIEKFPGPMELTRQQPERRFLEKRLAELG